MSGQVSGSGSPNLNKPTDQLARAQEAQRVGKVEEVDPDARARQQRFQQMMDAEEPEETDDSEHLPSPFEASFYSSNDRDSSDAAGINDQKIPDPSYSSPPTLSSDEEHPLKGKDLPRSKEFWHDVDISDQPIGKPKVSPHAKLAKNGKEEPMPGAGQGAGKPSKAPGSHPSSKPTEPSMFGMPGKTPAKKEETSHFGMPGKSPAKKEETSLFGMQGKAPAKKEETSLFSMQSKTPPKKEDASLFGMLSKTPAKKEESPLFGMPSKSPAKKEETTLFGMPTKTFTKNEKVSPFDIATKESTAEKKTDRTEPATPSAQYWTPQIDLSSNNRPGSTPSKDSLLGKKGSGQKPILEEVFETPPKEFSSAIDQADIDKERLKAEALEGETERKNKKSGKMIEIIMPSLPELPISVQPTAMAATNLASPYLRPETFPLFFQMVGTMTVMSNTGVSRTEITLNNPAFSNSRFFGATIEITRYASAPDAFNIRLSGTNEAVTAFNQNIPSLMAAFQTGNFNFRVGRIDVEYTTDRPVLRRKDSKEGGKGDDNQEESR